MISTECPNCQSENAYVTIVDETGTHYECSDCGNEWTDKSSSAESDSLN